MRVYIRKVIPLLLSAFLLLIGCHRTEDGKVTDDSNLELASNDVKRIKFAFEYLEGIPSVQREVFGDIELVTSGSWKFKIDFMQYSSRMYALSRIPITFPYARQLTETEGIDAIEANGVFDFLASNG